MKRELMALPQAHGVKQQWTECLKNVNPNFLLCFSHGLSHNDMVSDKYTNIFELLQYAFVHLGRCLKHLNLRFILVCSLTKISHS